MASMLAALSLSTGTCLLHLSLRALLVAPRGDGERVPGHRLRHGAGPRRRSGPERTGSCSTSSIMTPWPRPSIEACRSPERFAPLRKAAPRDGASPTSTAPDAAPPGSICWRGSAIGLRTCRCRDVTVRRRRVCRRRGAPIWPQFAATTRRNATRDGPVVKTIGFGVLAAALLSQPATALEAQKRAGSTASSPSTRSPTACRRISSIG